MVPAAFGSFQVSSVILILIGCLYADPSYSFALFPSTTGTARKNTNNRPQQRWRHNLPAYRQHRSFQNNDNGGKSKRTVALVSPSAIGSFSEDSDGDNLRTETEGRDYLITDSLDLDAKDRPTAFDFLFKEYPREGYLRMPLLVCGTVLSLCNVLGFYEESIYAPLVVSCVGLGLANAAMDATESRFSKDVRRGAIDGKVLQVYAASYSASISWLALRVYPPVCPEWLLGLDPLAGTVASFFFFASLAVPTLSLLSNAAPDNAFLQATQIGLVCLVRGDPTIRQLPFFTPIEKYRATSLLIIGFVACLYLPVSSYLAIYGDQWWSQSLEQYPQQGLLETSTALFGLIAAQSNISIMRAAGYGVRPVRQMANLGTIACIALAVVPCASALYFLQSGTTFFDHYDYHLQAAGK